MATTRAEVSEGAGLRVYGLQGYLAHKKERLSRTLQHNYAQDPMVALEEGGSF